jgi:hypothetical protein
MRTEAAEESAQQHEPLRHSYEHSQTFSIGIATTLAVG